MFFCHPKRHSKRHPYPFLSIKKGAITPPLHRSTIYSNGYSCSSVRLVPRISVDCFIIAHFVVTVPFPDSPACIISHSSSRHEKKSPHSTVNVTFPHQNTVQMFFECNTNVKQMLRFVFAFSISIQYTKSTVTN